MAIQKQEFYEGAAIHRLACFGELKTIALHHPFFLFNEQTWVYFKYSTKNRGPWGFTFAPSELRALSLRAKEDEVAIGLICGFDGIATVYATEIMRVCKLQESAIRIACSRKHGAYYRVWGPEGDVPRKVSPSDWTRLLNNEK